MLIRPFRPDDADALAALFHASVREIGIRDYSPAQVEAWSPAPPHPADYLRRASERLLLVAENERSEPIGYADLAGDGHIDHLYCRPDAVGTGVGAALVAAIEAAAIRAGIAAALRRGERGRAPPLRAPGFPPPGAERVRVEQGHGPQLSDDQVASDRSR